MSVHIHTTIPKKSAEILEQLATTYGTKSRAIAKALETMLRVDEVGSCDDCAIKAQIEEQEKLREALDLASVRKELLDELLKVALADHTIDKFLQQQQKEAQNIVELIKSSIQWKVPTNFREFLSLIEHLSEISRLFNIASHRELDNTVIVRPAVLSRVPEIVAYQIALILEGIGVHFDLRLMRKEIIVKMIRRDLASVRRMDPKQLLLERMEEKLGQIKPQLFKDSLALIGPAFLQWAAKNLEGSIADLGTVIEDIRLFIKPEELPEDSRQFIDVLLNAGRNMNWLSNTNVSQENDDKYRISFQATSPPMANLATVIFVLILATKGWKLINHKTEYNHGTIVIKFAGIGRQDVLDQLIDMNLFRVVNEQFLNAIQVPRDLFQPFAKKVYETDRRSFEDIYRNVGFRIANAIRMLAKNDEAKLQQLTQRFIIKNLYQIQPNAEIRFIDEYSFSIVFKEIEPMVIESQQLVIESILEALGYEVSITAFQNLLNVKMKKTDKPILGPLPRSEVVQMVGDAMAANSMEEALQFVKPTLDELYPLNYPWTIREIGDRLLDMYRELGIQVELEYFEGGFTLKYRTCPYYRLVKNQEKTWLCTFRKRAIEYILSRVTKTRKGRIKIIKSLIQNGSHPCEYAIFLEEFLAETTRTGTSA